MHSITMNVLNRSVSPYLRSKLLQLHHASSGVLTSSSYFMSSSRSFSQPALQYTPPNPVEEQQILMNRPLKRDGSQYCQKEHPFKNILEKCKNPLGYVKFKMQLIDDARKAYEKCSQRYEQKPAAIAAIGLPDTFHSWFLVTTLHVWMLNVRLRAEGPIGKEFRQELFNTIWADVEIKLSEAKVRTKLGQIMETLIDSYYGQTLAYDEGLYKGDAILGAALWRNVAAAQQLTPTQMRELLRYVRQQLQHIESLESEDFLSGNFEFL